MTPAPVIVGVCGASGQAVARAVIHRLLAGKHRVAVIATPSALAVAEDELAGPIVDDTLRSTGNVFEFDDNDLASPSASGSVPTSGMIVCPCTLNSLAKIATGLADTLLTRTAAVHLKQRRRLVLAVREMPLSSIDLENMTRLAHAGAVIAPLSPGFYHHPETVNDLIDHLAERLVELTTGDPPTHQYAAWPT